MFIFREGEGREKERERHINVWLPLTCSLPGTWPATQACALTGTSDPLVHRPAFNPLSRTSSGINFPFSTTFTISHTFQYVIFSFSFVSRYFLIYFVVSPLTHCHSCGYVMVSYCGFWSLTLLINSQHYASFSVLYWSLVYLLLEISIQFFCPFFNWIDFFFFMSYTIYSRYKFFIRHIHWECFLQSVPCRWIFLMASYKE